MKGGEIRKKASECLIRRNHFSSTIFRLVLSIGAFLFAGCAAGPKHSHPPVLHPEYAAGTIISGFQKQAVSFDVLAGDLASVPIVYVGEEHTSPEAHAIQLRIMKALRNYHPDLIVGMEMFAKSYNNALREWTSGKIDEKTLIGRTHWYVNWKFDFSLYRPLLDFTREHHLPLVGLNIPFHIPSKIAAGGIDSLSECEKNYLPGQMDMNNLGHREYIRQIFEQHAKAGPVNEFENFYTAQVVWEETMADTIARNIDSNHMIIFTGNGHITHKFGIPQRAARRTGKDYRTVMPFPAGQPINFAAADYIWITPAQDRISQGP